MDQFLQAIQAQKQVMATPKAVTKLLTIRHQVEHHLIHLGHFMDEFQQLFADYGPNSEDPQLDDYDLKAINKVKGYFLFGGKTLPSQDIGREGEITDYVGLKDIVNLLESEDDA